MDSSNHGATLMAVSDLPADNKIKVVDVFQKGGPWYRDCDGSNWDFYMEDPDNRSWVACPNTSLHFWVEVVKEVPALVVAAGTAREHVMEATEYTEYVCLGCAMQDGHLTEAEIQAFSPVAWKNYQIDKEQIGIEE